ncbi:TonB family protein [Aggregicoccus sp. 17bor-14]|uniref:TonB family protein n=1 Tax=Myxococcaceae TaxID=31 RepID=UPI00129C2275|nr:MULTISPECIES: TonB family protein [Myxococcaceae]MBF5045478.1 TonB family protein [Simulacricoccus sp. 17bor-14]MRI91216.1 TonB family protein [Aggregicoccus sp. 17bor-14]
MTRLPLRSALGLLLLTAACSSLAPAVRLPSGPQQFDEPPYSADVRARIVRHNGDVYACYQEAAAQSAPQGPDAPSAVRYDRARNRFLFAGPPDAADEKARPLSPFALAFERCLGARLSGWIPFSPPDGVSVSAYFYFLPPGSALPPPSEAPARERPPSMDPAWNSPLFDEGGARGFVDVAEMTTPRKLAGRPMQYTQEALAKHVAGVMQVRCRITVEGTLRDCAVLRSIPELDQMALDAFATHRYTPVLYRGKPLEVDYTFTVQFNVPKG